MDVGRVASDLGPEQRDHASLDCINRTLLCSVRIAPVPCFDQVWRIPLIVVLRLLSKGDCRSCGLRPKP